MKKKYFASVYQKFNSSKPRSSDRSARRSSDRAFGHRIKSVFNGQSRPRTFASGLPAMPAHAGQAGFTLIELLVVIGIIAILAAVVIVAINPARQFALARDTQRTANIAAILDAVDENMAEHKGILTCNGAPSILGMDPNFAPIAAGDTHGADLASCLAPTYISSLPYDPSKGSYKDTTTYDTGYMIMKDSNSHITVMAQGEVPDAPIEVTR